MIRVRVTTKGEPDMPALTKAFDFGSAEEDIFFSSSTIIREKLEHGMRINVNEATVLFSTFIVSHIREGRSDTDIQKRAAKILTADNVMIGVPESLQSLTFEVELDRKAARRIEIQKPIPLAGSNMLAG